MRIGIDAKRIFSNATGLGVYGRNLMYGLSSLNPEHDFLLYTPKQSTRLLQSSQLSEHFSIQEADALSSYFWRTFSIKKDLERDGLDIYHGLSNELPIGIEHTGIKCIVDIHDLCFVRFKADYSWLDRQIFWYKAQRAAKYSHKIIATSLATKKDIIRYFDVPSEKVEVIYQCCDQSFYNTQTDQQIRAIRLKYTLPKDFVLSVGTIQGRKNQKAIIEAMALLPKAQQAPIVLVGNGKQYLSELLSLAKELKLSVHLLPNVNFNDLPSIYQSAKIFIYPSIIEGFGIPVLEAMASKVPVITSRDTSMAEVIQNEACLVDPTDRKELSEKIAQFLSQENSDLIEEAHVRSLDFSQELFAQKVLKIYKSL